MINRRTLSAVAFAALAPACGPASTNPSPDASTCDQIGRTASPSSAEARWTVGLASRYPADTALGARADEIHRSQRARRAVAWEAIARTLAPVPVEHATAEGATVPRFRTWYDREDVARTFQRLYEGLGAEGRVAQTRFSDAALDEAFGWNVNFVNTLPEWNPARLANFTATLANPEVLAGVSGVQRIAISPDAVRHLVSSYPELLRCLNSGAPPAFADGPAASQQVAREPITLTSCGNRIVGPFFVAAGGQLTARIADASASTELRVLEGVSPTAPARCTAAASTGCTVTGPAVFSVRVSTLAQSASGMLDVQYTPPTTDVTACLRGAFPPAAATVALEWRRTDLGMPFPTYDTSAAALARHLAPTGEATWGTGDATAEPDARSAYTMRISAGSPFRLAGMHIRTRELDHWLNITLWWSSTPDEDFGADRPASVRALGGPWSSYKMCVATDFDEQDPDPSGGFAQDYPTLGAALRTVYEGRGAPSWCSNPYIDAGPGLVRSNCVGCHQHAMSGVRPVDIQTDSSRYPFNARTQVRNNYPADGFWGIDGGDQLGSVFTETAAYWHATH